MEPRFSVATAMDERAWTAATHASFVLFGRRRARISLAVMDVIGLAVMIAIVNRVAAGAAARPFRLFGVALYLLVIGVTWARTERSTVRRMTKANMKNAAAVGQTVRCAFSDDGFTSVSDDNRAEYQYSVITALADEGDYFVLFWGRVQCFILDKRAVTGGDAGRLRDFLGARTGLRFTETRTGRKQA